GVPPHHAALPHALRLYRDDHPLARHRPRLRHGPHHDQWRPGRPHRADLDADDPRWLPEQPDGHGQRHGLRLHPALHRLHRILLPQAGERPRLHGRRAMSRLTVEKPWQRWLIRLGVFIAMAILVVPGAWVVLTAFRPNI